MTAIRERLLALAQKWRYVANTLDGGGRSGAKKNLAMKTAAATQLRICAEELTALADQLDGDMCGARNARKLETEALHRLLHVAAEIARRENMPHQDDWRWPSRATQALYSDAIEACNKASDQCARWTIELKSIWDELSAPVAQDKTAVRAPDPTAEPEIDLEQFDGHTPGPWIDCEFGGLNINSIGEHHRNIARIASETETFASKAEREANARLIAAAPLLLAELRRLRGTG